MVTIVISKELLDVQTVKGTELTGASSTDTQSLVAVDRTAVAETIKWLAHVSVTKDGVREDQSRWVTPFARVFVANRDIVATRLAGINVGWSCGGESRQHRNRDGNVGKHRDGWFTVLVTMRM
jgi:hypothetical protein